MSVWGFMHVSTGAYSGKSLQTPGTEVTDGCEPPDMVLEN